MDGGNKRGKRALCWLLGHTVGLSRDLEEGLARAARQTQFLGTHTKSRHQGTGAKKNLEPGLSVLMEGSRKRRL